MTNTEVLKKCSEIIAKFLIKNGGFNNGLDTYAEGFINGFASGSLKVRVHDRDKTLNQLSKLAYNLEYELKEFLKSIEWDKYKTIDIKAIQREGCYTTNVSITESERVDMWF